MAQIPRAGAAGTDGVPVSPRLRDFLERWLEETVRPTLSPATTSNYDMFTRLYIIPDLGDRKLDKLMVRDVQVWVNTPGALPVLLSGQGCRASRATVLRPGELLSRGRLGLDGPPGVASCAAALTQAMREELVFRNVAALVRVPMPRSKRMPVWTVDEARQFLESAREDGDPMYAGYVLLLTLGLRRGRCSGWRGRRRPCRWRGAHRVAGPAGRPLAAPAPDEDPVLGRPLPLPEIAVRALERHRLEEARRRLAVGDMWGDCVCLHDPARRSGRPTQLPP